MTAFALPLRVTALLSLCLLDDALTSFPVTVDRGGSNIGFNGTQQFTVPDGNNPLKGLRHFCGMGALGSACLSVRDYLVQVIAKTDPIALDHVLPGFVDDTIVTLPNSHDNGYILPTLLVWNSLELLINLHQLGKGPSSSILALPPFKTNVEAHVT